MNFSHPGIRPVYFKSGSHRILAGISTRHGGFSEPPFQAFNLGRSSGEDVTVVMKNRELYASLFGVDMDQMVFGHQCHGTDIADSDKGQEIPATDGFMTRQPGLLLNVSVADCFPVWFYDVQTQTIAVTHCGWRGTVGGIQVNQLIRFRELGSDLSGVQVIIGPGIRSCHFQVRADIVGQFPAWSVTAGHEPGTWFVDLPAILRQSLTNAGLADHQISDLNECTACLTDRYYSYRAEKGITGRMMAGIMMRPLPEPDSAGR